MTDATDPFIPPINTSPSAIAGEHLAAAQTINPDIRALGLFDDLLQVAGQVSSVYRQVLADRFASEVKRYVGDLFGVQPTLGSPARSTITVKAIDALGHDDLVDGTILYLGDVQLRLTSDIVLAPGDTAASGSVEATAPGSAPNGSTGALDLEPLDWIDTVTLDAPLADGTDPEDDTAFGIKLAAHQENLSIAILQPADAVRFALFTDSNIGWAYAVPDWNPTLAGGAGATQRKHNMLVIAKLDGTQLTDATRDAMSNAINAITGINYVWHVVHPQYVPINVTAVVAPEAGWETFAAQNADDAITDRVRPGRWLTPRYGLDPNYTPPGRVHMSVLIAAGKDANGVEAVESLVIGGASGDEVLLNSPRKLPTPGTITVTLAS